jgi:hypothetical protein
MARTDRRNLLVIGSLKLLKNMVPVNIAPVKIVPVKMAPVKTAPGMNSDYPLQATLCQCSLGRTNEVFVLLPSRSCFLRATATRRCL